MHNPNNFRHPECFIPDRFIKDGQFINDPRVCIFSMGLRNCIGKQLAVTEYFTFAADIINNFKVEKVHGSMEPAKHTALLIPKDDIRIRFSPRT